MPYQGKAGWIATERDREAENGVLGCFFEEGASGEGSAHVCLKGSDEKPRRLSVCHREHPGASGPGSADRYLRQHPVPVLPGHRAARFDQRGPRPGRPYRGRTAPDRGPGPVFQIDAGGVRREGAGVRRLAGGASAEDRFSQIRVRVPQDGRGGGDRPQPDAGGGGANPRGHQPRRGTAHGDYRGGR